MRNLQSEYSFVNAENIRSPEQELDKMIRTENYRNNPGQKRSVSAFLAKGDVNILSVKGEVSMPERKKRELDISLYVGGRSKKGHLNLKAGQGKNIHQESSLPIKVIENENYNKYKKNITIYDPSIYTPQHDPLTHTRNLGNMTDRSKVRAGIRAKETQGRKQKSPAYPTLLTQNSEYVWDSGAMTDRSYNHIKTQTRLKLDQRFSKIYNQTPKNMIESGKKVVKNNPRSTKNGKGNNLDLEIKKSYLLDEGNKNAGKSMTPMHMNNSRNNKSMFYTQINKELSNLQAETGNKNIQEDNIPVEDGIQTHNAQIASRKKVDNSRDRLVNNLKRELQSIENRKNMLREESGRHESIVERLSPDYALERNKNREKSQENARKVIKEQINEYKVAEEIKKYPLRELEHRYIIYIYIYIYI